jgi:hydrogenase maturation protease
VTAATLVLALGNPLLGDEGLGLVALEELRRTSSVSSSVELLDGGTSGLSLVPRMSQAERVLVLDAVSAGQPPGTVLMLDGRTLASEAAGRLSPHQVGLAEVLAACRLMHGPKEIVILGVEPETTELGVGLSEAVSKAIPKLVAEAGRQLEAWKQTECTSSR